MHIHSLIYVEKPLPSNSSMSGRFVQVKGVSFADMADLISTGSH